MLIKRLLLVVISLTIGFLATWAIIETPYVGSNLVQYGFIYTASTTLALACAVGVWLDKFMGTKLLPK